LWSRKCKRGTKTSEPGSKRRTKVSEPQIASEESIADEAEATRGAKSERIRRQKKKQRPVNLNQIRCNNHLL